MVTADPSQRLGLRGWLVLRIITFYIIYFTIKNTYVTLNSPTVPYLVFPTAFLPTPELKTAELLYKYRDHLQIWF